MSFRKILKNIADKLPARWRNKAYRISALIFNLRTITPFPFYDMYYHIANLKKLGFDPDMIIDEGACFGEWTENVTKIFPAAKLIMFEPRIDQQQYLNKLTSQYKNIHLEQELLGEAEKDDVIFYEMGTGSSIYQENTASSRISSNVKMTTLDAVIKSKYHLPEQCFLKLDVQGAEIDVLKGAAELLSRTDFLLLEISTLNYNEKAPQFTDVIIFLKSIGFILFDICDERRLKNAVLYQTDMIFVKESSGIRRSVDFAPVAP